MTILVFGNPDIEKDALPLRLLARLQERFPSHTFVAADPNEEYDVPEEIIVIDTIENAGDVSIFDSLAAFEKTPRITLHDFDALTYLRHLIKIGRIKKIKIIGVPPMLAEKEAFAHVTAMLRATLPEENGRHSSYTGHMS